MPGNEVDSLGVPTFNVSIVFYMLWGNVGQQNWLPGTAHSQRFKYVLHALRRCQVTKLITGVPKFEISIVFYMLWENAG